MCGSGGDSGGGAAAAAAADARAAEERRQARYQEGLDSINRLYDFGETRVPAAETPEWQAWNAARMGGGRTGVFGLGAGGAEPTRYREGETGWARTAQPFDDAFFAGRSQIFRDFAMPQVDEQSTRTSRELEYWLARQGLTRSSVAGEKQRDFALEDGRARMGVEQQAQDYGAQARGDVAAARQAAISALQATNDPSAALTVARDRVGSISTPPAFSPVGSLFSNTLATVGAGAEGYRNSRGGYQAGSGVRYYGGDGGSGTRTVGAG